MLLLFLLILWDPVDTLGKSQLTGWPWACPRPPLCALVMRGAGDHRLELGSHGTLHRCLDYVLEELKHNAKAKVMVASHNEDTVRFTLRR